MELYCLYTRGKSVTLTKLSVLWSKTKCINRGHNHSASFVKDWIIVCHLWLTFSVCLHPACSTPAAPAHLAAPPPHLAVTLTRWQLLKKNQDVHPPSPESHMTYKHFVWLNKPVCSWSKTCKLQSFHWLYVLE